jgi:hypothetical protein
MTRDEELIIKVTMSQLGLLVLDDDSIKYMLDNNITPADIGLGVAIEKKGYKPKIDRWTLP